MFARGYVFVVKGRPGLWSTRPPVLWVHRLLSIPYSSQRVVVKPGSGRVLVVTDDPGVLDRLIGSGRAGDIEEFYPARELLGRIMDNIGGCGLLRIWSTAAVVEGPRALRLYMSRVGRIVSMKTRVNEDGSMEFEAIVRPDNHAVAALYSVYGIGYLRNIGYGAVNTRCAED